MANWKKIILKDDNAELATVTASVGLRITGVIPGGGSSDNVMVVDASGNVKSISQGSVSGVDTTYTSSGTNITMSSGQLPGNVAASTTFSIVPGQINHNDLLNYEPNEHIDWSVAYSPANSINEANYTNTEYANGTGIDFEGPDSAGNYTASTNPNQSHVTGVGALSAGSIVSGFGNIVTTGTISGSTIDAGIISAVTLDTNQITASNLNVTGIFVAEQVNITGSLAVSGSFIHNAETFAQIAANQTTGSNSWGSLDTDSHYFTGSVTASGGISASFFTGDGSGLTGIDNSNVNTATLTIGNGLALNSGNTSFNGTSNETLKGEAADNGGLEVVTGGFRIATDGIKTANILDANVTAAKIAPQAITKNKLDNNIIEDHNGIGGLNANHEILISTGSGLLAKTTLGAISSYVDSEISYTTATGSVTSVTTSENTIDGITISQTSNATTTPVITLGGSAEINNTHWITGGQDLSIANGGTGQSSKILAANALLNTSQGGALTIGNSSDTITIPGNLEILGSLTSLSTTNTTITDKFMLIGSGSTDTAHDIGIKFGQATTQGNTLIWDGDYSGSEGRFGVKYNLTDGDGGVTDLDNDLSAMSASYHLVGFYNGADPAAVKAEHVGNIKLDGGAFYIYA